MSVKMIVAIDRQNGIGKENGLPWPRKKSDMEWFQNATIGHVVLMGRKTAESIPRALKDRINIVFSARKLKHLDPEFGQISGEPEDVIEYLVNKYAEQDIWIIGGAQTYQTFAKYAEELFITIFPSIYESDTYLPNSVIDQFPYLKERHSYDGLEFVVMSKKEK